MLERASRQLAPKEDEEPETNYTDLLPVLALAGLGGIRFKEITRLTWEDVRRIPEHHGRARTESQWYQGCQQLAGFPIVVLGPVRAPLPR